MTIEMSPERWLILLGIVNIPVYFLAGWIVFNSWSGLLECLGLSVTSRWRVRFDRDLQVDVFWVKMKLLFFVVLCAGAVFGEYKFMQKRAFLKDRITIGSPEPAEAPK